MERLDAVVIGAGVVGLACARALAQTGREVVVLEAEAGIGQGVSSRSSEVIHAGLYYPTGSLKARLCVEGRRLLYTYCKARGIAHAQLGKLVVATRPNDVAALERLLAQGEANGVEDLRLIDGTHAQRLEPALTCHAALWSQQTGILDSHGLMLALEADLAAAGGQVIVRTPVRTLAPEREGLTIVTDDGTRIGANIVVNAAGLSAVSLAARVDGYPSAHLPRAHYARGHYFALATGGGRAPFSRLIYPIPEPGGLGVHLTLDLAGQARFGPDVEWIDPPADGRFDYDVDPARAAAFAQRIRAYWPGLPEDALVPAYAGIRPKVAGPGEPAADFVIQDATTHGIAGLINLFGIESPGLTSALALGRDVAARLG